MISYIKKTRYLLILLCFFSIAIIFVRFYINPVETDITLGSDLLETTGEILPEHRIDSSFVSMVDGTLSSFRVFFSTYNRENEGKLRFSILDNSGEKYERQVELNDIVDNQFFEFADINLEIEANEIYSIRMESNPQKGAVTAWYDKDRQIIASGKVLARPNILRIIVTIIVYCFISLLLCLMIGYLKQ